MKDAKATICRQVEKAPPSTFQRELRYNEYPSSNFEEETMSRLTTDSKNPFVELRSKTIVMRMSLLALLAAGCSGSVEDGSEVGVPGGPSAQKPRDETRSVFGRVRELSLGQSTIGLLLPLDSVNVCAWHDGVRCAFSSREGVFNFGDLSTGSQVEVTFSKDGYLPTVTSAQASRFSSTVDVPLLSSATASVLARSGGFELAADAGAVIFTTAFMGYGELIPMSGVKVDIGSSRSLYVGAAGAADASLEESSPAAWGAAFGLPQGVAGVKAMVTRTDGIVCGTQNANSGSIDSSFDVAVVEGYVTYVSVLCAPAD
jgi:hypothetical protein